MVREKANLNIIFFSSQMTRQLIESKHLGRNERANDGFVLQEGKIKILSGNLLDILDITYNVYKIYQTI